MTRRTPFLSMIALVIFFLLTNMTSLWAILVADVTLSDPSEITASSMKISWTASTDAGFQAYKLYKSLSPGVSVDDELMATITDIATLFTTVSGLNSGTLYYYKVFILADAGTSEGRNEVSATTLPEAVTLNTPAVMTPHTITLNWTQNMNTNFKEYRVYQSSSAGVDQTKELVATISTQTTTSKVVQELVAATKYYYKVYAVDSGDQLSAGSNEVSATTTPNLFPFSDTAEGATLLNYQKTGNWGLTQTDPHSTENAWTDSPQGSYSDNDDVSLTLRINLQTAQMPVLSFWTRYGTEVNADFCRVEISNDGSIWQIAGYWSGSLADWKKMDIDLTPWALDNDVYIRWRLTANGNQVSDGWYIDDITITETPIPDLDYPFTENFDPQLQVKGLPYAGNWFTSQWDVMSGGRSTPYMIHDSPVGYYIQSDGNYTTVNPRSFTSLTTAGVIDMSSAVNPILVFYQKYDIENRSQNVNYDEDDDRGRVYLSDNYGLPGSWHELKTVTGTKTDSWERVELDLKSYAGNSKIRLRFIVDDDRDNDDGYGDQSNSKDGWWIDDIRLEERPVAVTINLPSNVTMHGADLSWSQNADNDFARYQIYRNTSASESGAVLLTTITTQETVTYRDDYQVLQPQKYYYWMYVFDELDDKSYKSNVVSADYTVPTINFPVTDNADDEAATTANWAWGYPWGRTTAQKHSGTHAWTDSPGESYSPNANTALSTNVNLSGSTSPVLSFWHYYDFETNMDFGYVEVSTDGGNSWTIIHSVTGTESSWNEERIDLSNYIGNTIGLRLRMVSNGTIQHDGWYLDDVEIQNGTRIVDYPFQEDFETGFSQWFAENPWGLTDDNPHGGTAAMTESPNGTYTNNLSTSLLLHINLSTAQMPVLKFWHRYGVQIYADYCRVEISLDGSNWEIIGYWNGSQPEWIEDKIDLTPWQGSSDVRIRWRVTSNATVVGDGWIIDDISINESDRPVLTYPFGEQFDESASLDRWFFAQWEIITGGRSAPNQVHDSPVGDYLQSDGNYTTVNPRSYTSLTTSSTIDMTEAVNPVLLFYQKYDIENRSQNINYDEDDDRGRVYLSDNYGLPGSWQELKAVTGTKTDSWERVQLDLKNYAGNSKIRLRFIVDDDRDNNDGYGDQSNSKDGWWIDDIRMEERPLAVTLGALTNVSMHGATVNLSLNEDSDFQCYRIYRNTSAEESSATLIQTISNQSTVSYADTYTIIRPNKYYYWIYVYDNLDIPSYKSNVVSADYTVPTVTFPFQDLVETGTEANWAWSYPWGLETDPQTGTKSWADSPGANYGPNTNTALTINVNLSGSSTPVLRFWHKYAFEDGKDYGHVEVSTNGGSNWSVIHSVTNVESEWNEEKVDLFAYIGSTIGLRFRVVSDGSNHLDGWNIDDIKIENGPRINSYPFSDNLESGPLRWFYDSPWGLTTAKYHSGSNCWTDSPAGNYSNSSSSSLTLRIDLSDAQMPFLKFWTQYGTEANADFCRVEISNDGAYWTVVGYWSGSQSEWKEVSMDVTPWAGASDVLVRWRLSANSTTVSDGWYIDDIVIDETPIEAFQVPFFDQFDDECSAEKWYGGQWQPVSGGRSTPNCIHDSPIGNYLQSDGGLGTPNPRSYTSLTTSSVIDLTGTVNPVLVFYQKYDIENRSQNVNYDDDDDRGRVYLSGNFGLPGSWTQKYEITGSQTATWEERRINLAEYKTSATVRIRFIVDDDRDNDDSYGDQSNSKNGWWLDDIAIFDDLSGQTIVNKAKLLSPAQTVSSPGNPTGRIYGIVNETGITDASGQGAGIVAQLGYGPDGVDPSDEDWTWFGASYLDDYETIYDRYYATLTVTELGNYDYAYRFSLSGGPWIYADLDGNDRGGGGYNDYCIEEAGDLLIALEPNISTEIRTIDLTLPVNAIKNWVFAIKNGGPGDLRFTIEEDQAEVKSDLSWLAVSPVIGTVAANHEQLVTVTFDATDLEEYVSRWGTIRISSNDPDNSPLEIMAILRTVPAGSVGITGVIKDKNMSVLKTQAYLKLYEDGTFREEYPISRDGNYALFGVDMSSFDMRVIARDYFPEEKQNVTLNNQVINFHLGSVPAFTPTTQWVVFYGDAVLNNNDVQVGDVVVGYDPEGTVCGNYYVQTAGQYGHLKIYGDDAGTAGTDEGAEADDVIRFLVNGFPAEPSVSPVWTANGNILNVDLTVANQDKICLNADYNLISFTVAPYDGDIDAALTSIQNKYSIVQSFDLEWQGARTYVAELAGQGFNDLLTVDPYHGYWLKTIESCELTLQGDRLYDDTPLVLDAGWNLTSYLPEFDEPVGPVLASIDQKYQQVNGFEQGARTYVPGSQYNDLTALKNGYGYWIRMLQSAALNYSGAYENQAKSGDVIAEDYILENGLRPTPWWDDLYGQMIINSQPVAQGDILSVYDSDHVKCGECIINYAGQFGIVHVYGDDPASETIDEGAQIGDELMFCVNGIEVTLNEKIQWLGKRSVRCVNLLQATTVQADGGTATPREFSLSQNYPNPFNPTTTVDYQLPHDCEVRICIYDMQGALVKSLVNDRRNGGAYSAVWNGKNEAGRHVPTGVYLLKMTADDFQSIRKMLLIK